MLLYEEIPVYRTKNVKYGEEFPQVNISNKLILYQHMPIEQ